jgi:hypothetical protein
MKLTGAAILVSRGMNVLQAAPGNLSFPFDDKSCRHPSTGSAIMPSSASVPGSVLTASVLMLIHGGLLLLCGVCGSVGLMTRELEAKQAPINPMFVDTTWFPIVSMITFYGVGLPMVIAGIGLLKLNRAARILAYVTTLADLLIGCMPLMGVIFAYFRLPGPESLLLSFLFMGLLAVVKLALDVPVLICLSRSAARAAFSGANADLAPNQA